MNIPGPTLFFFLRENSIFNLKIAKFWFLNIKALLNFRQLDWVMNFSSLYLKHTLILIKMKVKIS